MNLNIDLNFKNPEVLLVFIELIIDFINKFLNNDKLKKADILISLLLNDYDEVARFKSHNFRSNSKSKDNLFKVGINFLNIIFNFTSRFTKIR